MALIPDTMQRDASRLLGSGDARKPSVPRLERGRYSASVLQHNADLTPVQQFRAKRFDLDHDRDDLDASFDHILIENTATGQVVGTFRIAQCTGEQIINGYAAQYYDLKALTKHPGPCVELGRFCVFQPGTDADIIRLAWAMVTQYVDCHGAAVLFGCSSLPGCDPGRYADAFAWMQTHHSGPEQWAPGVKAPETHSFSAPLGTATDISKILRQIPPLLRTYLTMGAWVSDHAVIDRQMNTVHVFTALEIAKIPFARKKSLRGWV